MINQLAQCCIEKVWTTIAIDIFSFSNPVPLVTTTRDSWGSLTLSNSWSWNSEEREKKKTKPLVCSNLNKKALRSNTILTTVDKNSPCSSFNRLIYFSIITSSRSQYLKNTRSVLHCKLQWTHNKKKKREHGCYSRVFLLHIHDKWVFPSKF